MEEENAKNFTEIEVSVDEEVANEPEEEITANDSLDRSASNTDAGGSEKQKLVRLPLARLKHLIKMDPDCGIVSQDSVFLIAKATELFLNYMSQHIAEEVANSKRKTVMRKDVDAVIRSVPNLCFLDGALE